MSSLSRETAYDDRYYGRAYENDSDDLEPHCYTPSCGETEGLELIDTPYGSAYVCQTCKVSYQHQQRVREAFEGEDY